MENEVGYFALLHCKKKLGIAMDSEEERDFQELLLAYEQLINWEKVEAALRLEAEMDCFEDEIVSQFQEEFEARYGLSEKRTSPFRKGLRKLMKVAAVLAGGGIIAIILYLTGRSGSNGQVSGQVPPRVGNVNISRESDIELENGIHSTIPLTTSKKSRVITEDGAITTSLRNDSLFYEVSDRFKQTDTGYHTITVPAGKQLRVILPDKSSVCLNANSSIRIPLQFGRTNRVIAISGDCFIEVAHDAEKPFTVLTETLTIEATGTHFNIDTRSLVSWQQVTLFSGQINVKCGSKPIYLAEGEVLRVTNDSGTIIRGNKTLVEAVKNREQDKFDHKKINTGKLIKEIAEWYGLIIADTTSLNLPFDMRFEAVPKNVPVENILAAIERHHKVKFSLKGNVLSVRALR